MKKISHREQAEILKNLAHPVRLRILRELARVPRCVNEVSSILGVPQSTVSQHLLMLRRHQVVDFYQEGVLRFYYLSRPALVEALLRFLSADYPVKNALQQTWVDPGKTLCE